MGQQAAVTGNGPQVSLSATGQNWSAPATVGQNGSSAAIALAPGGRAVAAWVGGPSSAPVVQASVLSPGGSWSTPVTVGGDGRAPVVGMDAAGDAIVAWEGSTGTGKTGPVYTASLPAGGAWGAVTTLTQTGAPVQMAVNPSGAVVIGWGAVAGAAWAGSGRLGRLQLRLRHRDRRGGRRHPRLRGRVTQLSRPVGGVVLRDPARRGEQHLEHPGAAPRWSGPRRRARSKRANPSPEQACGGGPGQPARRRWFLRMPPKRAAHVCSFVPALPDRRGGKRK